MPAEVIPAEVSPGFELDPRLAQDSQLLAQGPLSQLRLMDDLRFPWLVLVPRLPGACEWLDLELPQQGLLLEELNAAGTALRTWQPCDKLNIGALGNIVRQLHVHLVARREGDAAWPGPVWGFGSMQRTSAAQAEQRLTQLRDRLTHPFWQPS
jgi:diadenosine tetraphosphate (Ap4A) HIT family hydrolase